MPGSQELCYVASIFAAGGVRGGADAFPKTVVLLMKAKGIAIPEPAAK